MDSESRFARQMALFGREGQQAIRRTAVTVVGVGGLGTHVVQQLALLGVGALTLIDAEELDDTNRNRYIGAFAFDPIPGSRKVILGARLAKAVDPLINVTTIDESFVSERGFAAIRTSDWVFGCVDRDGARLILTELCAAYGRPYIDSASEIIPEKRPQFGGRVIVSRRGGGCPVCLDQLDLREAQCQLSGPEGERQRDKLYGMSEEHLPGSGPSVVSLNGVIASIAVTEFMVAVTGIRAPETLQTYYGREGRFTRLGERPPTDCYYCKGVLGCASEADVERYIRGGYGNFI